MLVERTLGVSAYIGKTCPYCHFPIKHGEGLTACPSCGIPHHTECWQENGGCTVLGCAAGPQLHAPSHADTHSGPSRLVITKEDLGLAPRRLSPFTAWTLYAVVVLILIVGTVIGLRQCSQYAPSDFGAPEPSDTAAAVPPDVPATEEPSEPTPDSSEPSAEDEQWVTQTHPEAGVTLEVPGNWTCADESTSDEFFVTYSDPDAEAGVSISVPQSPLDAAPYDIWEVIDGGFRLALGDKYALVSTDSTVLDGRDAVVSEFTLNQRDGTVLRARCFVVTGGYLVLCKALAEEFGDRETTFTRIVDSIDLP